MARIQALAIWCEDIRSEASGSDSIVGTLGDNIHITHTPSAIPKIAIYYRIHIPIEIEVRVIKMRLETPWGDIVELGEIDETVLAPARAQAREHGSPLSGVVSRVVAAPFAVLNYGRFLAYMNVDGEDILCGTLNVVDKPGGGKPTRVESVFTHVFKPDASPGTG